MTSAFPPLASVVDQAGDQLGGFLPRLGGAVAILVVGLLVAWLAGRLLRKALAAAGLDDVAARAGVTATLERAGLGGPVSTLAGRVLRVLLTIVTLFAALSLLGLQFLSDSLNEALLFLPNVLVSALLVLAGVVLAEVVRSRLERVSEQLDSPVPLGQLAGLVVLAVFLLTALAQLRVSTEIVTLLLTIVVGAAAAAMALAFGLGGRDAARALSAGRYVRHAIEVGQTITVADVTGQVTDLDATAVVLRTPDGTHVRVPNHLLLDTVVRVHDDRPPAA